MPMSGCGPSGVLKSMCRFSTFDFRQVRVGTPKVDIDWHRSLPVHSHVRVKLGFSEVDHSLASTQVWKVRSSLPSLPFCLLPADRSTLHFAATVAGTKAEQKQSKSRASELFQVLPLEEMLGADLPAVLGKSLASLCLLDTSSEMHPLIPWEILLLVVR